MNWTAVECARLGGSNSRPSKPLHLGFTPDYDDASLSGVIAQIERRNRLYEAILSATPDLIYVFDLDHRFIYANDALLQMWGKSWDEAIGRNCLELGYETWHAAMHDREIKHVVATGESIRGEVPFDGTNGRRIYDYIFVPVFDGNGQVEAVAGTTRDVTERKDHEQHQVLLSRELKHRVKNTLSVIQAIAGQSFDRSSRAFDDFSARVVALSNGLDVLTQKDWSAAHLTSLVDGVLSAHRPANRHRLTVAGPDVIVRPRSVVALSLALNELATNAIKYGALSNTTGTVSVTWTTDDGRFLLRWYEAGGPAVVTPTRRGFGSRLIQQNLAAELGGTVDIAYEPTGIVCVIDASLDAITGTGGETNADAGVTNEDS